MSDYVKDERGITLIELIASIVILSIILISFFPMLIQSAKFTEFNEEKLTAVAVAEEVVAEIRFLKNPQELESMGYSFQGTEYIDVESYEDFEVKVTFKDQSVSPNLRGAIVTVSPTSGERVRKPFITEIYINVGNQP